MKRPHRHWFELIFVVASVVAFCWTPLHANSQPTPPAKTKGLKATPKEAVDLGPEIQGMTGRQLRLRVITLEPGGQIRLHSHKNRPAVLYVLEGSFTIISADGKEKVLRAGDTSSATGNTSHWGRNTGTVPAVWVITDIFEKKK